MGNISFENRNKMGAVAEGVDCIKKSVPTVK
jgi:hypothetical protein